MSGRRGYLTRCHSVGLRWCGDLLHVTKGEQQKICNLLIYYYYSARESEWGESCKCKPEEESRPSDPPHLLIWWKGDSANHLKSLSSGVRSQCNNCNTGSREEHWICGNKTPGIVGRVPLKIYKLCWLSLLKGQEVTNIWWVRCEHIITRGGTHRWNPGSEAQSTQDCTKDCLHYVTLT